MTISKRLFGTSLLLTSLLSMAIGALLLGVVQSDDDGGRGELEVRVAAKRLDDGRVEVGVQQRDGDGWSERLLPEARFLAADAEVDVWRSSSPVAVDAPAAAGTAHATARYDITADPRELVESGHISPGQPVLCLVSDTHGDGLHRICDTLRELHDGEVTTLSSLNPMELIGQYSAAMAASEAVDYGIATSLSTAIIATQAMRPPGEPFPFYAFIREFRPNRSPIDDLFCLVGHGPPGAFGDSTTDTFWGRLGATAGTAGGDLSTNVRFIHGGSEGQAAAIGECVEAGASVIATTLADVEQVAEPIAAAQAAGVPVVTYNSGAESAAQVGSALHIALDDYRGGVLAGERFKAEGVEGKVLCVLHEANNVGLEQRCDGFAEGYGGEVEQYPIHHLPDQNAVGQAFFGLVSGPDAPAGIITLNGDTGIVLGIAIARTGSDVVGATFGVELVNVTHVLSGALLFVVEDHPLVQGYLTTAAMSLANILDAPPDVYLGSSTLYIVPRIADQAVALALLQGLVAPR